MTMTVVNIFLCFHIKFKNLFVHVWFNPGAFGFSMLSINFLSYLELN